VLLSIKPNPYSIIMATAVTLCDTVVKLPLRYKESVNVTQTVHESMEATKIPQNFFNGILTPEKRKSSKMRNEMYA